MLVNNKRNSRKTRTAQPKTQLSLDSCLVTTVFVVLVLMLVLKLTTENGACYSADNSVATHFVPAKVARCTTSKRTHQAAVALGLCIGICGTVLLLTRLTVSVGRSLTLWILIVGIRALLGKLLVRWCARVLTLLLLLILIILTVLPIFPVLAVFVCK